jgi:DNA-binding transcriptional regulator YhcF (GntR family)
MSLGTDDSRPPYLQVAELLRKRVATRQYGIGERLPPTRELADEFGVAPNTVLSAIRVLRDEGLVSSQQGRGTFVRAVPESGSSVPTSDFKLVMDQLEQFQADLQSMRHRLEQLEHLTARLLDKDSQPAQ